jgi:uncharacterized membrane-anchored protein YitT (DUF2179 family)
MSAIQTFNERPVKEQISDILLVVFGNLSLAISSVYFVLPFNLLTGGVAGISVIINKFTHWDETIIIDVLIVLLFVIGTIFLGKNFAIKTTLSTILYPAFIFLLGFFPLDLPIEPLLASVYAGVLTGMGVGMVFRTGGSTGGMDIPPLLMKKYLGIELSKGSLIVDGITVAFGLVAYGMSAVLIGLISVYASSVMIDKMLLLGGEQSKAIYIISDNWNEINEKIQERLGRGTTLIAGKGGYSKDDKPIVFVVIQQRQYAELKKIVNHVDPLSFVVVSDATEVQGEGFTYHPRH